MKKIVVAIDFSEQSEKIAIFALKLAEINKAEIMLFHTVIKQYYFSSPSIPEAFEFNTLTETNNNDDVLEAAKTKMDTIISTISSHSASKIKIAYKITEGIFEDELETFCDDYFPSVIIVGSRGIDQSNFLFGSRAIGIFNKSKFPVIAAPAVEVNACISNVMFIADLESSNSVLIRKTFNKLENCDPKIFCVHLAEDNNYLKAYSSKEYLNSEYTKEIAENKFQCDVLESEDKQEEIDSYIKKNNIGLIVFMPHKANFFQRLIGKNKSKNYLFETRLPILAIRM